MTETNGNGYAKRFHLYVTAIGAIVAIGLSVTGFMREIKDDKARQQAGQGLNEQQTTITALRASVEFNRQLLLALYTAAPKRARTPRTTPDIPRSRTPEGPRRPPETDRDAHVPPVPKLTPPDELFKNAPQIPEQRQRNWQDYEQRIQ